MRLPDTDYLGPLCIPIFTDVVVDLLETPEWVTNKLRDVQRRLQSVLAGGVRKEEVEDESGLRTKKKMGRPADPVKAQVVAFVRQLRKQRVCWKDIPNRVFTKHKVSYASETLRGYLKTS